jgi:hypothetical protein
MEARRDTVEGCRSLILIKHQKILKTFWVRSLTFVLEKEIHCKKVATGLKTCLNRVKNRDNADHIPVSDEKVQEYNQIAAKVEHPWMPFLIIMLQPQTKRFSKSSNC